MLKVSKYSCYYFLHADLWLPSHEVCWDSNETGRPAAAPWPHHHQSHNQVCIDILVCVPRSSFSCFLQGLLDIYGFYFSIAMYLSEHQIHFICQSLLFGNWYASASSVDPTDQKKTACYDIDVEVEDPLKSQMNSFLSSTTNQQEIAALEMKVTDQKQLRLTGCEENGCLKCPVVFTPDPRDNRVHQPAEDRERLHAQLQQQSTGLHPGLAQVSKQRPEGKHRRPPLTSCTCLSTTPFTLKSVPWKKAAEQK